MQPYQQRVVDERDELRERIDKLDTFINQSDSYTVLPHAEKRRLVKQSEAMELYCEILDERIANF